MQMAMAHPAAMPVMMMVMVMPMVPMAMTGVNLRQERAAGRACQIEAALRCERRRGRRDKISTNCNNRGR
jgi:uncharacterized membrane protein